MNGTWNSWSYRDVMASPAERPGRTRCGTVIGSMTRESGQKPRPDGQEVVL